MFNVMATVNVSVMTGMNYHADTHDDCADDNGDDCDIV